MRTATRPAAAGLATDAMDTRRVNARTVRGRPPERRITGGTEELCRKPTDA
jgi:hypothetical protein